jgi:hypothetical protein
MIKQYPGNVYCYSLAFHGDLVYVGNYRCGRQWNLVTDAVVRLQGYSGSSYILTEIVF